MASIKRRDDGVWRARYRDAAGREHAQHFTRKVDAQRWIDEVTTAVVTGQYVDSRAGKVTVRAYATTWRASQSWRDKTSTRVESALRVHVLPAFGDRLAAHLAATGRREGLIFADAAGLPIKRNTFGKTWVRAVHHAGLDGLRLHDMRHAYASALIVAGESVKVIQARMGHASAMVTLDVYGHLWPDSDDKTRAAIKAFLAPVARLEVAP